MGKQLTSRKWILTVFFSIVSVIALFTGYVSEGTFMSIAVTLIGGYTLGNVGSAYVATKRGYNEPKD